MLGSGNIMEYLKSQLDFLKKIKEKYSYYEYIETIGSNPYIYLYPNYLYLYSYPWLVKTSDNSMCILVNEVTKYKLAEMSNCMDFITISSNIKVFSIFDEENVFKCLDNINEINYKIIQKMKNYQVKCKIKSIENDFVN